MGDAMFRPDVIVQGTDRPQLRLAVEIALENTGLEEVAWRLKRYMHDEACPLGLLVTPWETRVYQETWSDTAESIQQLTVVDTSELLHTALALADAPALEKAVRGWLEALTRQLGVARPPDGEEDWVEQHLLPALVDAEVMVAGPR